MLVGVKAHRDDCDRIIKEQGKASRTIIVGLGLAGAVLAVVLFLSNQDDGNGHLRVSTANFLRVVSIGIVALEDEFDRPAPTEMPALVAWLCEYDMIRRDPDKVDEKAGALLDRWGERVVPLVEDGRLTGLGSPGPDRTWRDGCGDDIIVMLKEVL